MARTSRLMILATAVLFSTGGAAIKQCGLSSWQIASFRSGVAALALLLLMPSARRGWSWRTWIVGVAYAATMVLYVLANKLTTAANTIFLQATAPLYILLLGPWLLREPVSRRDVSFMAVVAAGLAMFFVGVESPLASAPDPFRGNVLAAGAGLSWGLTLLGLRWMGRDASGRQGAAPAVVSGNLLACLFCLPRALPVLDSAAADWWLIGYLGVFQIGLAYVFLTLAFRHVPALEASLLLLLEPVLNPVWAWMLQGERPGPWSLLGGGVILLATVAKTWLDFRRPFPVASPTDGS